MEISLDPNGYEANGDTFEKLLSAEEVPGFLCAQRSLSPRLTQPFVSEIARRHSRSVWSAKPSSTKPGASEKAAARADEGIQYVNAADWDSDAEEALETTSRTGRRLSSPVRSMC
jgi:hypothetical protein